MQTEMVGVNDHKSIILENQVANSSHPTPLIYTVEVFRFKNSVVDSGKQYCI